MVSGQLGTGQLAPSLPGSDPQTRRALLSVVAERAAAGAAAVYTTQYLPELAELGATATLARLLAAGAAPVSIDILRPGLDDLYAALHPLTPISPGGPPWFCPVRPS